MLPNPVALKGHEIMTGNTDSVAKMLKTSAINNCLPYFSIICYNQLSFYQMIEIAKNTPVTQQMNCFSTNFVDSILNEYGTFFCCLDYKNLAAQQYQESKDKARYISIAQKLAQHINNLAEDKNTRIRWIWQLIQNAKDVPNEFGRCRMRIQIRENKFIFAHNGDPFRVSDLESIVAQYSSKPEENKTQTETTGKYGTGFITTYILSRKVRIKGLLNLMTRQEKEEAELNGDFKEEEEIEMEQNEEIINKKAKSSELKQGGSDDQQEKESIIKKKKNNFFEGGSLYQRFEIFLDREYKDRDTEFCLKLMRTEHNLIKDLMSNDPEPKWQRKEGELNTQFIYEDLDEAAFKMIEQGMIGLKELFAYALLFNSKLFEIQVIDKRKGKRIKNFGIKRADQTRYNNLKIFNATILEEGKENSTFSAAYLDDENTLSTVAMPLRFEQEKISLVELNHKMPKIFKEFPLIGCKDTGFNFVFTSRRFYPNESRSDLLLAQIEGRNSIKSRTNWQSLQAVFYRAKSLYKALSLIANHGQQKLLIISVRNQFTHNDYQDKKFSLIFHESIKEISEIKFIDFKNERRSTLKQIIFPMGKSYTKKYQDHEYSKQMNSVFSVLMGQGYVLSDEAYERYYPIVSHFRESWNGIINFKELNDCLKPLQQIKFNELIFKCGDREKALTVLQKIYDFIHENNPSFLTKGNKVRNEGEPQTSYVLTNKLEFKDLWQNRIPLYKKSNVPDSYGEVADYLGISYNENLIFDRFAKYFEKVPDFTVQTMLNKFKFYFKINTNTSAAFGIVNLGRFVSAFKISSKIFAIAEKVKDLVGISSPIKINDIQNELKMPTQMAQDFKNFLEFKVITYINEYLKDRATLTSLMHKLNFFLEDRDKVINWLNELHEVDNQLFGKGNITKFQRIISVYLPALTSSTAIITTALSMTEKFSYLSQLQYFSLIKNELVYKGNYPNKVDLALYQLMRKEQNRKEANKSRGFFNLPIEISQLQSVTLHPLVTGKWPKATTFKTAFNFTIDLYNNYLNKDDKIYFIDYLSDLILESRNNPEVAYKLDAFSSIVDRMYYDYARETKCLKRKEDREFMFYLLKNPEDIKIISEIQTKYGLREALKRLNLDQAKKAEQKPNLNSFAPSSV